MRLGDFFFGMKWYFLGSILKSNFDVFLDLCHFDTLSSILITFIAIVSVFRVEYLWHWEERDG